MNLTVIHQNIRSLNCSQRLLKTCLLDFGFPIDVICISEIWSTNLETHANLLDGYKFEFVKPNGTVGGAGLFILDNITYTRLDSTLRSTGVEDIWVILNTKNTKLILRCIYRHPNSDKKDFRLKLNSRLWSLKQQPETKHINKIIITGDINIDIFNNDDDHINNCLDVVQVHKLISIIDQVTRVTG